MKKARVLLTLVGLLAMIALSSCEREKVVVITPDGNKLGYATTSFTVKTGSKVEVQMVNSATSGVMLHNVVILNSESENDVARIGMAALRVGEAGDWLPEDAAILAATPMAKPGRTTEISFRAPSVPGRYIYFCSYPGHFATMKGFMIVE